MKTKNSEGVKKCQGCKYVYVRSTGSRAFPDYQRICSKGLKNKRTGHALRIEGDNDRRCKYYIKQYKAIG